MVARSDSTFNLYKLPAGKRALVRLLAGKSATRRSISRDAMKREGLLEEFRSARRAGLIASAHYECSGEGDTWLETVEGQRALSAAEVERRREEGP